MPDIAYINHSLNGGEVSARFEARQDQNKYLAACAECLNFTPLTLGGVTRTPGTIFVVKAKNSGAANNGVRLIPFIFNQTESYVLEFGHQYVRFYRDGSQIVAVVDAQITPARATLLIASVAPIVRQDIRLTPPVANLSLLGIAPIVTEDIRLTPTVGSVAILGIAPTVTET